MATPRSQPSVQATPRSQPQNDLSPMSQHSGGRNGSVMSKMSNEDSTFRDKAYPSGSLTARESRATAARREEASNKAYFQKLQKQKEHAVKHDKLLAMRERDEANVRERAARQNQVREKQFKDMMDDIRYNDSVRVEAAHIIQQYENEREAKRHNVWSTWDREVSQRIELQLQKYMTRKDPNSSGPPPGYREELLETDDPAKRSLVEQRAEDQFRRIADTIIQGHPSLGERGLKDYIHQRQVIEETVANRPTTRPVLPVELWGQQELFAGPYGYFAQRCERTDRGESFHSIRRMGADRHRPDETDGISAAGKKREKTRLGTTYNHMGMLVGDHCKVGQSYRYKRPDGAGSGAPMQDHYCYEKGNDVVEKEFPSGKRCFKNLVQC